ncbi:MAG: hypothetical protein E7585_03515 [Ruminococcaceae bacterium]|nr:hypothetical protein [Oscillospiraceae bacterium]
MKRILFLSFFTVVFLSLFCVCASAKIYEGRALDEDYILGRGEGEYNEDVFVDENYELAGYYKLMYRLDTETGEMRIFMNPEYAGKSQKMLYYAQAEWVPWTKDEMRPYIKTVIIEEGILSVGRFSFWHCENLETVYIPHSVLRVDQTTFYECPKLKNIYYAGTQEDFKNYVEFQDMRNSYTGGNKGEVKAIDLIHYGASFRVRYRNQDGEYFRNFTVGGYHVGDSYTVTPAVMEGLTFVGKNSAVSGKFKKNDKTVIEFEYVCDHTYAFTDMTKPCSSVCLYCECADPLYEQEHIWVVEKDIPRSFLKAREMKKTCSMCGLTREIYEEPYWMRVSIISSAVAVVVVISLAIILPVVSTKKKKKKMKDLTW